MKTSVSPRASPAPRLRALPWVNSCAGISRTVAPRPRANSTLPPSEPESTTITSTSSSITWASIPSRQRARSLPPFFTGITIEITCQDDMAAASRLGGAGYAPFELTHGDSPLSLDAPALLQHSRQATKSVAPGARPQPQAPAAHGQAEVPKLAVEQLGEVAQQRARGQILGDQPDAVAPKVIAREVAFAPERRAAHVVDDRLRHVAAREIRKLRAQRPV